MTEEHPQDWSPKISRDELEEALAAARADAANHHAEGRHRCRDRGGRTRGPHSLIMPGKQLDIDNGDVRDVAMCEYHEIMRGQPDPDCPLCTEANRAR